MTALPEKPDRLHARLVRHLALAAALAAFVLSFAVFEAITPKLILWLAGEPPGARLPLYGAPALARVLIAAGLALGVAGMVFALMGRGVIFRSERLASPAPDHPLSAALTFGLLGLAVFVLAVAAVPVVAPYARWPRADSVFAFVLIPAFAGFFWRLMVLAAEGAAAQRRARRRERGELL
ncbi:MAG: hypothetical protein ACFE0P_04045 [Oceanicaulis sp.]